MTAFQLAWPPFAYGIKDDGEARVVYRSVLTVWLLVALAVVLPLALARDWLVATLAGEKWLGGADAMALTALGSRSTAPTTSSASPSAAPSARS